MRPTSVEQIVTRIDPPNENGCALWRGALLPDGYGRTRLRGRLWLVHRLVYTSVVGPIPDGIVLHHLCNVPACCTVEHLTPMRPADHLRHHTPRPTRRPTCARGHSMDDAILDKNGYRNCRTCRKLRQRARHEDPPAP